MGHIMLIARKFFRSIFFFHFSSLRFFADDRCLLDLMTTKSIRSFLVGIYDLCFEYFTYIKEMRRK